MKKKLLIHFKNKLIRRFTFYALIAFALTGLLISTVVSKHIEDDAIESKRAFVELVVNSARTQSEVEKNGIMIGARGVSFEENTNALIDNSNEFEIQATPNGKMLVIRQLITKFDSSSQLIAVFRFDYREIDKHIQMVINNVFISVFVGLFILYILLLRLIISSANQLEQQKFQIINKNVEITNSFDKLNQAFHSTVEALAEAVDARDSYTAGHSRRVTIYASALGKKIGLTKKELSYLNMASLLHDIGKIGISDDVLHKNSKLTDDEYNLIKTHPVVGKTIVENIPDFHELIPLIYHHHEKYDGSGYPSGTIGIDIPEGARIIAIADAFDAMTTNRPYRSSMVLDDAVEQLTSGTNTQFDPQMVELFLGLIKEKEWPVNENLIKVEENIPA